MAEQPEALSALLGSIRMKLRRNPGSRIVLTSEDAWLLAALPAASPALDEWTVAFRDTRTEQAVQDAKWGEQNHPPEVWLAILSEEVGEMAKEMLAPANLFRVREEAIQVAAVAVAFIEAIDRAFDGARLAAESQTDE